MGVQSIIIDPPSRKPLATIIFLHGLGANGHDFEPIAKQLMPILPLRWVLPNACSIPVTINGGMELAAWYDMTDLTRADGVDWDTVACTRLFVRNLIKLENERAPEIPIILGGFSQGAAMSLHCGFDAPVALKGIAALSSYVMAKKSETGLPKALDGKTAPKVFMGHGQWDDVLPLELAEAGRDALVTAGVSVDWHTYPMPHSVCPQELQDLVLWLMALLDVKLEEPKAE
jgi:phospholipase/carboxylesterase